MMGPAGVSDMDKLEKCIDALRVLATQPDDPNAQLLAETRINEYLRREIDDLDTSLKQVTHQAPIFAFNSFIFSRQD